MSSYEQTGVQEQRRILRVLSQLLSEFFISRKESFKQKKWNDEYRGSGDYRRFQMEFEKDPAGFHILEVTQGAEQDLEDFFNKNNIEYSYINATFLDSGTNGRYIIRDRDFRQYLQRSPEINVEQLYADKQEILPDTKLRISDADGRIAQYLETQKVPHEQGNGFVSVEKGHLDELSDTQRTVVSKQYINARELRELSSGLKGQCFGIIDNNGTYSLYLFNKEAIEQELGSRTADNARIAAEIGYYEPGMEEILADNGIIPDINEGMLYIGKDELEQLSGSGIIEKSGPFADAAELEKAEFGYAPGKYAVLEEPDGTYNIYSFEAELNRRLEHDIEQFTSKEETQEEPGPIEEDDILPDREGAGSQDFDGIPESKLQDEDIDTPDIEDAGTGFAGEDTEPPQDIDLPEYEELDLDEPTAEDIPEYEELDLAENPVDEIPDINEGPASQEEFTEMAELDLPDENLGDVPEKEAVELPEYEELDMEPVEDEPVEQTPDTDNVPEEEIELPEYENSDEAQGQEASEQEEQGPSEQDEQEIPGEGQESEIEEQEPAQEQDEEPVQEEEDLFQAEAETQAREEELARQQAEQEQLAEQERQAAERESQTAEQEAQARAEQEAQVQAEQEIQARDAEHTEVESRAEQEAQAQEVEAEQAEAEKQAQEQAETEQQEELQDYQEEPAEIEDSYAENQAEQQRMQEDEQVRQQEAEAQARDEQAQADENARQAQEQQERAEEASHQVQEEQTRAEEAQRAQEEQAHAEEARQVQEEEQTGAEEGQAQESQSEAEVESNEQGEQQSDEEWARQQEIQEEQARAEQARAEEEALRQVRETQPQQDQDELQEQARQEAEKAQIETGQRNAEEARGRAEQEQAERQAQEESTRAQAEAQPQQDEQAYTQQSQPEADTYKDYGQGQQDYDAEYRRMQEQARAQAADMQRQIQTEQQSVFRQDQGSSYGQDSYQTYSSQEQPPAQNQQQAVQEQQRQAMQQEYTAQQAQQAAQQRQAYQEQAARQNQAPHGSYGSAFQQQGQGAGGSSSFMQAPQSQGNSYASMPGGQNVQPSTPKISVQDDRVISGDADRNKDSLINAGYNATLARAEDGIKESGLGKGLSETEQFLRGGVMPVGMTSFTRGTTSWNDTLTFNAADKLVNAVGGKENLATLEALMVADARKNGGAFVKLDFSTAESAQSSMESVNKFLADNKFIERRTAMNASVVRAVKGDSIYDQKSIKKLDKSIKKIEDKEVRTEKRELKSAYKQAGMDKRKAAKEATRISEEHRKSAANKDINGIDPSSSFSGQGNKSTVSRISGRRAHTADEFSTSSLSSLGKSANIDIKRVAALDIALRANQRSLNKYTAAFETAKKSIENTNNAMLGKGSLLDNKFVKDALKDDPTGQTFYKAKDTAKNIERVYDVGEHLNETVLAAKAAKAEKAVAGAARRMQYAAERFGTDSAQYKQALDHFNTAKSRHAFIQKKHDVLHSKLQEGGVHQRFLNRQKAVRNAQKAQRKSMKKSLGNKLKNTKFGKKATNSKIGKAVKHINVKKAAIKKGVQEAHKAALRKGVAKLAADMVSGIGELKAAIISALLPVLLIILLIFVIMLLICALGAFATAFIQHSDSHIYQFQNGDDGQYPVKEAESTFVLLYNELVTEECQWVNNLKNKMVDPTVNPPFLSTFRYTPNINGKPDLDNQHLHVSTYIPDWINTEYRETSTFSALTNGYFNAGEAKGPQPFEGAPEEAYKWIRIIDGEVMVTTTAVGDTTAGFSNVHEIMALASIASFGNDIPSHHSQDAHEITEDDGTNENSTFLSGLKTAYNRIKMGLDMAKEKFDNARDKILSSIPLVNSLWAKYKQRTTMKIFSLYTKPIFDQSHREFYALKLRILPTKRTAGTGEYGSSEQTHTIATDYELRNQYGQYGQDYSEIRDSMTAETDMDSNSGEIYLLAKAIYREAGNQSEEGQIAVGQVIMNRVHSNYSNFGTQNSVHDVVYARGQFASLPKIESTTNASVPASIVSLARQVYYGEVKVFSDDVIGFYNPTGEAADTWNGWHHYTTIGDHEFYSVSDHGSNDDNTIEYGETTADTQNRLNGDIGDEGWAQGNLMCSGNESQSKPPSGPKDEHNGYGCMSYNGFEFKYDEPDNLYYNGILASPVEPAANVDMLDDICIAPGNDPDTFQTRIDLHEDCWGDLGTGDGGWNEDGGSMTCTSDVIWDTIEEGYIHKIYSNNGGKTYIVDAIDEEEGSEEEGNKLYHHKLYYFGHTCAGDHTGYYCGGHFDLMITGGTYHITDPQRSYNQDNFEEKPSVRDEDTPYITDLMDPAHPTGYIIYEDMNRNAKDLFDIDTAFAHRKWVVHPNFEGWIYNNIEIAVAKLDEDWYRVYGVGNWFTIGGEASTTGILCALDDSYMNEILTGLDEQFGGLADWEERRTAIYKGLSLVGKVSYSYGGNHNGSFRELSAGSASDCSGFVSYMWGDKLGSCYSTSSFKSSFKTSRFSDGGWKPGDILLQGTSISGHGSAPHTLMVLGTDSSDGQIMVLECSGSGTKISKRGNNYLNGCLRIDASDL